jgi:pilus assembly protein CpaF
VTTAYELLRNAVHAEIERAEDLDPEHNPDDRDRIRAIVEAEIEEYQLRGYAGKGLQPLANPDDMRDRLLRLVSSRTGALGAALEDPDVSEIRGVDKDLLAKMRSGDTVAIDEPTTAADVKGIITRWVTEAGGVLDAAHPAVDGLRVELPGGRRARLSASVPPRIRQTISFVLRLPEHSNTNLRDLVLLGAMTPAAATFLGLCVAFDVDILIVGRPGAGKTTLIEGLLRALPARKTVLVLEEHSELSAPLLNGQYWQTSEVEDLRRLVRSALVNSPDLVVLGELKGEEAWDLCRAGNVGASVMAAVHADGADEAYEALAVAAKPVASGVTISELRDVYARMFDVVVFLDKDDGNILPDQVLRQVLDISVVPPQASADSVALTPIFRRADLGEEMVWTKAPLPERLERQFNRYLRRQGLTVIDMLQGAEVRL